MASAIATRRWGWWRTWSTNHDLARAPPHPALAAPSHRAPRRAVHRHRRALPLLRTDDGAGRHRQRARLLAPAVSAAPARGRCANARRHRGRRAPLRHARPRAHLARRALLLRAPRRRGHRRGHPAGVAGHDLRPAAESLGAVPALRSAGAGRLGRASHRRGDAQLVGARARRGRGHLRHLRHRRDVRTVAVQHSHSSADDDERADDRRRHHRLDAEQSRASRRRGDVLSLRAAAAGAPGGNHHVIRRSLVLLAPLALMACEREPMPQAPSVPVRTEVARRTAFTPTITLLGVVRAAQSIPLTAPQHGTIRYPRRFAGGLQTGARVARGELIAVIENDDLKAAQTEARLQMEAAAADFERAERSFQQGVISSAEYASRRVQATLAKERYAAASKRLSTLSV